MDLSTMAYLTIDAGGTYLKSAVLNQTGDVLADSGYVTKSFSNGSKEKILWAFNEIVTHGLTYIERMGMSLSGIGIAFPGPFDYESGTSFMFHKFKNIYGINLCEAILNNSMISPDLPIKFMHDANAVLAGELWIGNGQDYDNVAVVTLGTGLGFAFSENRIIQRNNLGGPMVTIYRLPYRNGVLEDYTAKQGILHIYQKISGKAETEKIKVSDIGRWADGGDRDSIQTFQEVGRILAESLEKILLEKKIQCLLLGGQISRSFHLMEEPLKEGLKEVKYLGKVSKVKSIENAALLGLLQNFTCSQNL